MLISFGAKNFFCFNEQIEINLKLSTRVPKNVSHGKTTASAIAFKGANASGKTNAVKILSFLAKFCNDSFSIKPEEEISVETFFGNHEPSDLFVNFESDGIIYWYELSLTKKEVISEKIYRKDQRKSLIFERKGTEIITNSLYDSKDILIRKNASIVSTLHQYEEQSIHPIYSFFRGIYSNVNEFGFRGNTVSYTLSSKLYQGNPEYLAFTKKMIRKFDTGIVDIEISSRKGDDDELIYFPIYKHESINGIRYLTHTAQSSGTKSLFNDLLLYALILATGGVLALDEFDTNLHPSILPHLIALFNDKTDNPKNSQIIISTHNNEVIDILGKYRTFLFNKRDGECFCYRLDEINSDLLRNDRPMLPLYTAGKLGGVPRI